MTDRELMQHALECLEWHIEAGAYGHDIEGTAGLLRALLAEPEPVAWVAPSWMNPETRTWESESFAPGPINGWIPLYTAPRQWQGLTDEEIWELAAHCLDSVAGRMQFARAIEAKLRERNA